MKSANYLIVLFSILSGLHAERGGQEEGFCTIRNGTTQSGEEIKFTVFYSVAGAYIEAGSASFTNKIEKLDGKTVYHVVGEGRSNASYDWIYKVRDRYESFIDTANMLPLKFGRDVQDGKTKKKEALNFNRSANTVNTGASTVKVPPCIQDVLSSIYYARNLDFSKYKAGDKIPFDMFLENEVHHLYVRYLGKEEIKTRYGRFQAVKFKPLLVAGTLFSGGEEMTVWVSDDGNRVPVRIESPIVVGSIKVDMTGYKNLRYELSALKKKK